MNREEFMSELEYLLQDIPEEDKADALDYYRDYLEEAGEEADAAIQEFGSPERIAAIIRTDIAGHLEEGGAFTERGYEDERFRDPNYQVAKRYDLPETGEQPAGNASGKEYKRTYRGKSSDNTVIKIVLVVILLVMTSPVWLGLGSGLFGIIVGLIVTAIALLAAAAIVTVALFIAGIAAGVAGAVHMMTSPLGGLLAIGIGLLLIAISLVCLVLSVQIYGRFFPWLFRGIMDLLNGLFHRKERER